MLVGLGVALALGCEARPTRESAPKRATSAAPGSHPTGDRYVVRSPDQAPSTPSASAVATPSSSSPSSSSSSSSSPAPIPSLVVGKAACDACLEAEKAGRYLTPSGVGHYLVGCDDNVVRQQCLAATKRSLPVRVRELVVAGKCDDARALVQFAVRENASSPTLSTALGACK